MEQMSVNLRSEDILEEQQQEKKLSGYVFASPWYENKNEQKRILIQTIQLSFIILKFIISIVVILIHAGLQGWLWFGFLLSWWTWES